MLQIILVALVVLVSGCVHEPVHLPNPPPTEFPIRVCPGSQDPRLVIGVVRDIGFQIGGTVTLDCVRPTVDINLEAANERTGGLTTWPGGRPTIELTRVAPCARHWVLRHELGHVMGLADDDRDTAMAAQYYSDNDCAAFSVSSHRFSDRDRAWVRSRL